MSKENRGYLPKIPNKIDHEENSSLLGSHSQVATVSIARHWVIICRFDQKIVDLGWTSEIVVSGVRCECLEAAVSELHKL